MDVGIVGAGTIGKKVARELDAGKLPDVRLVAINSRSLDRARQFAATLRSRPRVVPLEQMPPLCDLLIETAGASVVESVAKTALEAGKDVMVLSCGALLDRDDLLELARKKKARIHVPSGAIVGLDGLLAASAGRLNRVMMVTRKPPEGLKGSPGVAKAGVDLDAITEATLLYEGPVLEGFSLFPANINVSAAVSMAGIGPRRTRIQVYADPSVTRNTHDVEVEGEFGVMRFHIENVPSDENPRTGRLTALSVLAYLKQMVSPVHIGV